MACCDPSPQMESDRVPGHTRANNQLLRGPSTEVLNPINAWQSKTFHNSEQLNKTKKRGEREIGERKQWEENRNDTERWGEGWRGDKRGREDIFSPCVDRYSSSEITVLALQVEPSVVLVILSDTMQIHSICSIYTEVWSPGNSYTGLLSTF